jgi:hypothetical protein
VDIAFGQNGGRCGSFGHSECRTERDSPMNAHNRPRLGWLAALLLISFGVAACNSSGTVTDKPATAISGFAE